MQHLYANCRRAAHTVAALLATAALPAAAQSLNYAAPNAQNIAGSYQDLGTQGSVIATANFDDANSAATPIGFSFTYRGTAYTSFVLNTNGFLRLGNNAPSSAALFYDYASTQNVSGFATFPGGPLASTDAADTDLLLPFATDLTAATTGGTEYRVVTSGTSPNRVCTIQWKNVRDKPKQATATNTIVIGTQYENFSFQVKLYEGSGQIDFVYGPVVAGAGPNNFRTVAIGLKGGSPASGDVVVADKASNTPWANTLFDRSNYYNGDPHNVRSTVLPDLGRTYRFLPSLATDAEVLTVYTLAQVPAGTATTVQALISNIGTQPLTNLPVTLQVTGSNAVNQTQTLSGTLQPGATAIVTFPSYTAGTTQGTNTVRVSVPAGGEPSADFKTAAQAVTNDVFNHFAPIVGTSVVPTSFGAIGTGGITAVRYTSTASTRIQAVTNFIPTDGNAANQVIYGAVFDAAGNQLGRTADFTIQPANVGTQVTLPLTTPVTAPAGSFFVGIVQQASTVNYFPVGWVFSTFIRPDTYFFRGLATGPFTEDQAGRGYGPFLIGAVTNGPNSTKQPNATRFVLAPNPAHESVHLSLAASGTAEQTVIIADALGRIVREQHLSGRATQATLSVAGLKPGVYLVRVGTTTQRLVVQ